MPKINKLVYAAVFVAAGVLLPQIFHVFGGTQAGMLFLPMHIPVFICGIFLGSFYGSAAGLLIPVLSFLITGGTMPPAERLPFFITELVLYGIASGIFASVFKSIYLSLISSMIVGRLAYAGLLCIAFYAFDMKSAAPISVWSSLIKGIFGVIIQLAVIPPVVYALRRYSNDRERKKSNSNS
jgi:riboflavin transporter FmnP